MNKKKENAFTLLELLGIIVIIGLLSLITTPPILRSIENARKNTFKNSVEGILRTIQNNADKNNYNKETFTIENGVIKDSSGQILKTKGGKGETGSAQIDENGRVAITVYNKEKTFCAKKNLNKSQLEVTKYEQDKCE